MGLIVNMMVLEVIIIKKERQVLEWKEHKITFKKEKQPHRWGR